MPHGLEGPLTIAGPHKSLPRTGIAGSVAICANGYPFPRGHRRLEWRVPPPSPVTPKDRLTQTQEAARK